MTLTTYRESSCPHVLQYLVGSTGILPGFLHVLHNVQGVFMSLSTLWDLEESPRISTCPSQCTGCLHVPQYLVGSRGIPQNSYMSFTMYRMSSCSSVPCGIYRNPPRIPTCPSQCTGCLHVPQYLVGSTGILPEFLHVLHNVQGVFMSLSTLWDLEESPRIPTCPSQCTGCLHVPQYLVGSTGILPEFLHVLHNVQGVFMSLSTLWDLQESSQNSYMSFTMYRVSSCPSVPCGIYRNPPRIPTCPSQCTGCLHVPQYLVGSTGISQNSYMSFTMYRVSSCPSVPCGIYRNLPEFLHVLHNVQGVFMSFSTLWDLEECPQDPYMCFTMYRCLHVPMSLGTLWDLEELMSPG